MPPLCPECHHRPSSRTAEYGATCMCKCHDVADAAPALLAACRNALEFVRSQRIGSGELEGELIAAIALTGTRP